MPAFFRATVAGFLATGTVAGLNQLASGLAAAGFDLKPDQHAVWTEEWPFLEVCLRAVVAKNPRATNWSILLEYPIPGRHKRIDAILLTDGGIIVIEFKSGEEPTSAARWQVREYCWNLRDFHLQSRDVRIAPIVCTAGLTLRRQQGELLFSDRQGLVLDIQVCNPGGLAETIQQAHACLKGRGTWSFDAGGWDHSEIQPTPTVVGFAQEIFGRHDVREIAYAHADNTDTALACLKLAVETARHERKRIICFLTGVPGAGKTLVGLYAAYRSEMAQAAGSSVCFASGNQPLLEVLKAALVMNRAHSSRQRREVAHDVTAPFQNVHEFARDTLGRDGEPPPPFQVVVFDEAQRVWDAEKVLDGLNKRKRRSQINQQQLERILSFGRTEPAQLLSVMERCPDWCVVIALVGGGQEIHDGEAGLAEWGRALVHRSGAWTAWVPAEALDGGTGVARQRLFNNADDDGVAIVRQNALHLAISKRSLRAERYAEWVNLVVSGQAGAAASIAAELAEYPVLLVRDLAAARALIRHYADNDLRVGLLASSGAARLRGEGVEVSAEFRGGIKFPDWFLRPLGDIRSSSQLEVAATEFECQGLELDWCCVCWGGDFIIAPNAAGWQFRRIRSPAGKSPRWYSEQSSDTQEFLRNKYRVLLTRARFGVVLFVPRGDSADQTREPAIFDATADFLIRCGAVAA